MSPEDTRLECLRLALSSANSQVALASVVERARAYFAFVAGRETVPQPHKPNDTLTPGGHEP